MKSLFFSLLVLSLTSLNATANADLDPGIVKIEALNFGKKLSVTSSTGFENALVLLVDKKDNVVWKESISAENRGGKIFNLENLPAGKYSIKIDLGNREIFQPIEIAENNVVIYEYQKKVFFTPAIVLNENKLKLTYYNRQLADIDVSIVDRFGEVVYAEEHKGVLQLQKAYELKFFEEGEYTMVVKTPEKAYYQSFNLD